MSPGRVGPPRPGTRRTDAVALLLLLAAALAFWQLHVHAARPERRGPPNADLERLYVPTAITLHRALRGGRLPLWNPYQLAGSPFLAKHQPGALYPPNLLLLRLLSPARALEVHAVAHLFLAGAFTWLFLGRLGLGAPARAAGALAFQFADSNERSIYLVNLLSTSVWLPAMLWSLHGLLAERRLRFALALAGAATLAFLGGYAQGFVYQLQLVAAWALFALWRLPASARAPACTGLALAGAATAGLCAVQLLPTLEMLRHGGAGLPRLGLEAAALPFALAPRDLLMGLLGGLRWGALPEAGPAYPLLALPTAPLLLLGAADRPRRPEWAFFAAVAAAAGAFMLGTATPLYGWVHALPLGDAFRIPRRMVLVFAFAVCVLTALGIQGLAQLVARSRAGARAATCAAVLAAAAVGIDSFAKHEVRHAHPASASAPFPPRPGFAAPLAREAGLARVFIEETGPSRAFFPRLGSVERMFVVPDYDGLVPRRYQEYFAAGDLWHGSLVGARLPPPNLPRLVELLDLMSVRFYVLDPDLPAAARERFERAVGAPARPFRDALRIERAGAAPRAYAVFESVALPDGSADSFRRAAYGLAVRERALVPPGGPVLARPAAGATSRVAVTAYAEREVSLHAECSAPCLLVLTDLDYPGWEARVDGRAAPVHRANYLFRSVLLDPGRHRVEFRFVPRSLYAGAGVATLTLLSLLALGIWRRP